MSAYNLDDPNTISFVQRWSNYLTLLTAFMMIGGGIVLRDRVVNRSIIYQDAATGIRATYPQSWLIDLNQPDYLFRVRDMQHTGYKTTIQASLVPVGADTSERNVADTLALNRSERLVDYRQLIVTQTTLSGLPAERVTYTYVSREISPFLESIPIVVVGTDIIVLSRGQALVFTFRSDDTNYDRQIAVFERFLASVEF